MTNRFAKIAKSPGDCVECMANSDNVVRAGLTPKLIDTPTLVIGCFFLFNSKFLTYPFFLFIATPERVQGYVFIYDYKSSSLYCARAKRSFKSAMLSIVD